MAEIKISKNILIEVASRLLMAGGLRDEDAAVIAKDLIAANLRGLDSHGISRIPMYLERIRRGVVKPQPDIKVSRVTSAVALVDGDDGMGFLAAHLAMDEAIALAAESGIGLVGVRHSTHFGMAALYVKQALDAGFISMVYTNSSPALSGMGRTNDFSWSKSVCCRNTRRERGSLFAGYGHDGDCSGQNSHRSDAWRIHTVRAGIRR